jgi:hypothetical protein
MSEFVFLFRGRDLTMTPDQKQKHRENWVAWFKELSAKGLIKDPGHPLEPGGSIVKGKQKTVHDGPFAEAKDVIGGFTLIEARDLAHATEIAKGCPVLEVGGAVEIRPIEQMKM